MGLPIRVKRVLGRAVLSHGGMCSVMRLCTVGTMWKWTTFQEVPLRGRGRTDTNTAPKTCPGRHSARSEPRSACAVSGCWVSRNHTPRRKRDNRPSAQTRADTVQATETTASGETEDKGTTEIVKHQTTTDETNKKSLQQQECSPRNRVRILGCLRSGCVCFGFV